MWKKNGKCFANPLILDEKIIFNPKKEQLLEAGYQWFAADSKRMPSSAVRYSSLKIIRTLGSQWETIRKQLEDSGYLDQFLSANYIQADDPAFQLFLSEMPGEFITQLDKCRWTNN